MAISPKRNQFVMDNAIDGFDLRQLDNGAYVRTFPTGVPIKTVPKQVLFGEESRIVVGGSDHGAVYVFDRKTGTPLDVLRHADKGLVQTIAVCDLPSIGFNAQIIDRPMKMMMG